MSKDRAALQEIKNKRLLAKGLSPANRDRIYDLVEKGQVIAYYSKAISKDDNIEIDPPRKKARSEYKVNNSSRKTFKSDNRFEKLEAAEIHTVTQGDPIASGSVSSVSTAGGIVGRKQKTKFILNFKIPIPSTFPFVLNPTEQGKKARYLDMKKLDQVKPVVVAVLDTGINKEIFDKLQLTDRLWKRSSSEAIENNDDNFGLNFLETDNNIWTEKEGHVLHGSIVSLFILEKYANNNVPVQLMILKTHDKDGNGDLSTIIDAINYAIDNGANIINASWGFNSYDENMPPFLRQKITSKLKEKKILLIAAAGNKIEDSDNFANTIINDPAAGKLLSKTDAPTLEVALRNLDFHNFFPASLSTDDNNVFTITTVVNEKDVSKTQNFSNKRVDFGVKAEPGKTGFSIPFMEGEATNGTSSEPGKDATGFFADGSSFATAIASGVIASEYNDFVQKATTILEKSSVIEMLTKNGFVDNSSALTDEIKKGRILKEHPSKSNGTTQTQDLTHQQA